MHQNKFNNKHIIDTIHLNAGALEKSMTGGGMLEPAAGTALALVREVTLSNEHECEVEVRFRISTGPFRLLKVVTASSRPLVTGFLNGSMGRDSDSRFAVKLL